MKYKITSLEGFKIKTLDASRQEKYSMFLCGDKAKSDYIFEKYNLSNNTRDEINKHLYQVSFKKNTNKLDQFYTNPKVAEKCFSFLMNKMKKYINENDYLFLEPSAGDGSFYKIIPQNKIGFDLEPKIDGIIKKDFLTTTKEDIKKECITIGNPPFGKKSKLAIEFFNHCAIFSNTIAFIVPVQFRKWSVQSKLNKDFFLIKDIELEKNSFIYNGKPYNVNCCFQIWTKLKTNSNDIRIKNKPPVSHVDFKTWQYNNTKEALKVFDNDFDFAVPRQGYYDYNRKETDKNKCEKNIQWILFKANNNEILQRLKNIDFVKLSKKNTSVFGFGKADVVEEYILLYGDKNE